MYLVCPARIVADVLDGLHGQCIRLSHMLRGRTASTGTSVQLDKTLASAGYTYCNHDVQQWLDRSLCSHHHLREVSTL